MAHRILLTGSTGQVGGELLATLAPLGEVIAPTRAELDLTDQAAVRALIREVQPRWIVNPAAYTAVDKAESEPDLAYSINRDTVKAIGEEAAALDAAVIHFSTDYVFDGSSPRPYKESDPTAALGVYGASKLAGEQALAASGAAHFIFRTSWVYGATGKNFLLTILKLARTRPEMKIVADQHGAPTWSRDLARLTAYVMAHFESLAAGGSIATAVHPASGVFHASGSGETTWFGFAQRGIELMKAREPATSFATILPISTAEYPTPAKRPVNSRLDCSKLFASSRYKMLDWQASLQQVIAEL